MSTNNNPWGDAFERALEKGSATGSKKTTSQQNQTNKSDPYAKAMEAALTSASGTATGSDRIEKGQAGKPNHTKLDPAQLKRLESGYKKQDEQKVDAVRDKLTHFFKLQKKGEAEAIEHFKREEMERKRREEEEEAQKHAQEETIPELVVPKGKEKRSIFSKKQRIKSSQPETRVGGGK